MTSDDSYWMMIWKDFYKRPLGKIAFFAVLAFCLVGIYAPFLAASKPLIVQYDGKWYFPLFRYLYYQGYYTKGLDIFFNLLIFIAPLILISLYLSRGHRKLMISLFVFLVSLQMGTFLYFLNFPIQDPAFNAPFSLKEQQDITSHPLPNWDRELRYLSNYTKLNLVLSYQQKLNQQNRLQKYIAAYQANEPHHSSPTLWQMQQDSQQSELQRLQSILNSSPKNSEPYLHANAWIHYIHDRQNWLESQQQLIKYKVMPFIRPFHWEDDAGGNQRLNHFVPFWELTRINSKDLVAALIFGIRISLVVGILSVSLALIIGIPIGAFAGFYGGTFDIIVSRLLEIWEAMPTFFMLLMVVAILQSKSIFLVITIIGLFGWTTFSRYIRGEFFKQRNLPYTEACRAIGLPNHHIMFSHIMPNAIPPVLTLLPFAIMGAITSEAGLSFLGLGEENSCSWGVLMDEGRSVFPGEPYLLWPPAILLTLLLVAIALVGDSFRDALDPKMRK